MSTLSISDLLQIIQDNILYVIVTLLIVGAASSSVIKQASLAGYIKRVGFMILAAAPTYYVIRIAYTAIVEQNYSTLVLATGMSILTYLITRK